MVWTDDVDDVRRVVVDGEPVGDPRWRVRTVLGADADGVLVSASDEPTESSWCAFGWDGATTELTSGSGRARRRGRGRHDGREPQLRSTPTARG